MAHLVAGWVTRQQVRKVRERGGVIWVARCSHVGDLLLSVHFFQLLQCTAGCLVLGLLLGGTCLGHKPEAGRGEEEQRWNAKKGQVMEERVYVHAQHAMGNHSIATCRSMGGLMAYLYCPHVSVHLNPPFASSVEYCGLPKSGWLWHNSFTRLLCVLDDIVWLLSTIRGIPLACTPENGG